MASQYQKIEDFTDICWDKDSPVSLEKARLARDTYRGVNVLQLSFRNVCDSNIYELGISISMKDFNGRRVMKKDIEYNYYGMEIGINKTFGNDDYITVEPEAKSFMITVTRAEFSEGAMFRGSVLLKPMPYPLDLESLGEFTEPFTKQLSELQPKAKIVCAPEDKLYYWRCTCSRFYPHNVGKCLTCNLEKDTIFNLIKDLKAEKKRAEKAAALAEQKRLEEEAEKARLEEERIRREKELEEERKRIKKQRIKKACIFASSAAALLLIFLLAGPTLKKSFVKEEPLTTESNVPDDIANSPDIETAPELEAESDAVIAEPEFQATPLAVLGKDLTDDDMKLVLRLIGMEQSDFDKFNVIYVSQDEEQSYLSGKYDGSLLGGRTLSSLLITPTEPGSGLNIQTYNITYCTVEMYQEALEAAGIADADVVVAAPFKSSGTAAVAGIMKAGEYFSENPVTLD